MPSGIPKKTPAYDWVTKVDIQTDKKQVSYTHKASSRRYSLIDLVKESVESAFLAHGITNSNYPLTLEISLDLVKRKRFKDADTVA